MINKFYKNIIFSFLFLITKTTAAKAATVNAVGSIDQSKISSLSFAQIISVVVNLALAAVGIAFFLLLFIGGFRYLNSGGDPKAVASARTALTNAFIGLIIVVASFLIAQLLFYLFKMPGVVILAK